MRLLDDWRIAFAVLALGLAAFPLIGVRWALLAAAGSAIGSVLIDLSRRERRRRKQQELLEAMRANLESKSTT